MKSLAHTNRWIVAGLTLSALLLVTAAACGSSATGVPQDVASPVAQATAEATAPPTAIEETKPTEKPEPAFIVDVRSILGQPLTDVEDFFGEAEIAEPVDAGVLESLPDGGEVREYTKEYHFGLRIDKDGVVRSFWVEGLAADDMPLDDFMAALARLDFIPTTDPSTTTPDTLIWDNADGYEIRISAGTDLPIDVIDVTLVGE